MFRAKSHFTEDKISKPKQARESVLQPDCLSTDTLPLLGECDSGSSEAEPEPDMVEQLVDLEPSKMTIEHQISTIAVNLKVSRELLLQANRNLDSVENYLQQTCRGENQLDSATKLRNAQSSSWASLSSSSSMSTPGLSEVTAGPPSPQYGLLLHKGYQWAKHLEVQLLSRNWELLGEEELASWMHLYPPEQSQYESSSMESLASGLVTESVSDGGDHDPDEPTQYVSAMDNSNMLSGKTQQALSFQENADLTTEVCRPAVTEHPLLDVHHTEHESFSTDSEETDSGASVQGAQACSAPSTNMAPSHMALLDELSSITFSPSQPQDKFYSISFSKLVPPCNSTPRSPDVQQRVMNRITEPHLLKSLTCSPISSVDLHAQTFITAVEDAKDSSPPSFKVDSRVHQDLTANEEDGLQTETVPADSSVHRHGSTVAARPEGGDNEEEGAGGFKETQTEENQELMDGSSERKPGTHLDQKEDEGEEERLKEMEQGLHRFKQYTEGGEDVEEDDKEVKLGEDDADEETCWCDPQRGDSADAVAADPEKEELEVSPQSQQSPSFLQDTSRAHSTLDDVLQGFVVERISRRRGPREQVSKLCRLFEGQTGGDGRPAGDTS